MELGLWPFHLDFTGQYPLSQVVSRMVHVAGEHATHFGFGIKELHQKGITWMLSRLSIRFLAPITEDEPLEISTGMSDASGLTAKRVIRLAQRGKPVAESLSLWVAIDIDRRKPLPIEEILTDPSLQADFSHVLLPEIPRKVIEKTIEQRLEKQYEHTVRYSDLDINRHVNAAVWVSLAMDSLPIERFEQNRLKEAHLRFAKEALLGDKLDIKQSSEGTTDYMQIERQGDGLFQLQAKWEKV